MSRQIVQASSAINMIGPYLTAEATCPLCGTGNVLAHTEGYSSPVKSVLRCEHLRAMTWDDDGDRFIEFGN